MRLPGMDLVDSWRGRATGAFEKNGKWVLIVGGGAFALLALANFGAAITVAVILVAVAMAFGWVKLDD